MSTVLRFIRLRTVAIVMFIALMASLTLLRNEPVTAAPLAPAEWQYTSWVISERVWYGRSSLLVDGDLTAAAQAQAERMAQCGCLYHQDLTPFLWRGWRYMGENVAVASSAWEAHVAISFSPPHLANLLSPLYLGVGVGIRSRDGRIYVSEVYGGF